MLTARASLRDRGPVPSKAAFWIGGVLMTLAVLGAIAWTVLAFDRLNDDIDRFQRVDVPGEASVRLDARKYILYLVGPGADELRRPLTIAVTHRASERLVPARVYAGTFTYAFGETLAAQATVTAPAAGVHDVRIAAPADLVGYELAFGDSIAGRVGRIIGVAFVIGGVLGLGGLGVMIASGVRRSRSRRPSPDWPPPSVP